MRVRRPARAARRVALPSALLIAALGAVSSAPPRPVLLWNASASAPVGLYAVSAIGDAPQRGDMVAARTPSSWRDLAARRHYLPRNVPLIKRIAAMPGDRICAAGGRITVGGRLAAERRGRDAAGRPMPAWHGCRTLARDEFLLLIDHPQSFDGRYFGVTHRRDLVGKARLLCAR